MEIRRIMLRRLEKSAKRMPFWDDLGRTLSYSLSIRVSKRGLN
jgi:hypothetical protein